MSRTCAEWRTRLATLEAAELKALTSSKATMVQYGEKRLQNNDVDLPALQTALREARMHVNRCDGCGRRALIRTIPSDC